MTDPETLNRVLLPPSAPAVQMLRDLSIIHRMEIILRKLCVSEHAAPRSHALGRLFNRGNNGCP